MRKLSAPGVVVRVALVASLLIVNLALPGRAAGIDCEVCGHCPGGGVGEWYECCVYAPEPLAGVDDCDDTDPDNCQEFGEPCSNGD